MLRRIFVGLERSFLFHLLIVLHHKEVISIRFGLLSVDVGVINYDFLCVVQTHYMKLYVLN